MMRSHLKNDKREFALYYHSIKEIWREVCIECAFDLNAGESLVLQEKFYNALRDYNVYDPPMNQIPAGPNERDEYPYYSRAVNH